MHLATIDCGTTNSRVYIVTGDGAVVGRASREAGVRDTAQTGSTDRLRAGLREAFAQALHEAGLQAADLRLIASSGMITSEIGLQELPHLWAPADASALAGGITRVGDFGIFPPGLPVYFVRGIRNRFDPATVTPAQADRLDFMRGEETQVMGLLARGEVPLPMVFTVLSSHTKFVSVDASGAILGSLTTVSGQVYQALQEGTVLSKSIRRMGEEPDDIAPYRDTIDLACRFCREGGFLRALFITRFLDTLLDTTWQERRVFVEAVIAAEDARAIGRMAEMGFPAEASFVLVGAERRTRLYEYVLREKFGVRNPIFRISGASEIDLLSITGTIGLLRQAGIL